MTSYQPTLTRKQKEAFLKKCGKTVKDLMRFSKKNSPPEIEIGSYFTSCLGIICAIGVASVVDKKFYEEALTDIHEVALKNYSQAMLKGEEDEKPE